MERSDLGKDSIAFPCETQDLSSTNACGALILPQLHTDSIISMGIYIYISTIYLCVLPINTSLCLKCKDIYMCDI